MTTICVCVVCVCVRFCCCCSSGSREKESEFVAINHSLADSIRCSFIRSLALVRLFARSLARSFVRSFVRQLAQLAKACTNLSLSLLRAIPQNHIATEKIHLLLLFFIHQTNCLSQYSCYTQFSRPTHLFLIYFIPFISIFLYLCKILYEKNNSEF